MRATVSELILTEGWFSFSMTLPHVNPETPVVTMLVSPAAMKVACKKFKLDLCCNVLDLSIKLPRVDDELIKEWIDDCIADKIMYAKWCRCPSQCAAALFIEIDKGLENGL